MEYNQFEKLVMSRQACRDFNDKPLDKEVVLKIAKLSKFCPSACNSQPWKMYVVTDEKVVNDVSIALQEGGRNPFLKKAKAYIVVTEKPTTLKEDVLRKFSIDHFMKYDVGELVAYITLTAKSLGVDSIIIGWMNKLQLLKSINASDGEDCSLVVALGYSDSPIREKIRFDDDKVIKLI